MARSGQRAVRPVCLAGHDAAALRGRCVFLGVPLVTIFGPEHRPVRHRRDYLGHLGSPHAAAGDADDPPCAQCHPGRGGSQLVLLGGVARRQKRPRGAACRWDRRAQCGGSLGGSTCGRGPLRRRAPACARQNRDARAGRQHPVHTFFIRGCMSTCRRPGGRSVSRRLTPC